MNSRNIILKHLDDDRFRSCPVCQHAISLDHTEALFEDQARNSALELVPLDDDTTTFEIAAPNATLPPTREK